MNIIKSEHKVELGLIRIEHNLLNDGYFYTLTNRPHNIGRRISGLYKTDIEARKAAFKYLGIIGF